MFTSIDLEDVKEAIAMILIIHPNFTGTLKSIANKDDFFKNRKNTF